MRKGSKHTIEAKEKNRLAHVGKIAWNKGLKMKELHPHTGFQKGHKFYKGGEKGWFASQRVTGDKNVNWQGGTMRMNQKLRACQKYIKWRNDIFKRDEFRCQECFKIGGKLNVHHIIPVRDIIKQFKINNFREANRCQILWNKDNGITYCRNCHAKHDKYIKSGSNVAVGGENNDRT